MECRQQSGSFGVCKVRIAFHLSGFGRSNFMMLIVELLELLELTLMMSSVISHVLEVELELQLILLLELVLELVLVVDFELVMLFDLVLLLELDFVLLNLLSPHLLQPLHVSLFKIFKSILHQRLPAELQRLRVPTLSTKQLISLLMLLWSDAFNEESIRRSFALIGIIPYNPEVVYN